MNLYKFILILLGTLSLGVGLIGIVVPGLPTTPFLLITASLYFKSSDKLHQKFISIPFIRDRILKFQLNKGLTLKAKLIAIGTMWLMIILSCLVFISPVWLKIVVLVVGFIGTIAMGFMIPTLKKTNGS